MACNRTYKVHRSELLMWLILLVGQRLEGSPGAPVLYSLVVGPTIRPVCVGHVSAEEVVTDSATQ